jgi:3-dehydroquinate dehydratase type I
MRPRICVPIAARELSEIPALIEKAETAEADLIEIRLDYLDLSLSEAGKILENLADGSSVPMIATNREYSQGGLRRQDEKSRVQVLIRAAEAGFRYVDIELGTDGLESLLDEVKSYGAEPIVSFHDFKETPTLKEMERIVKSEIDAGAEVCKLVTTARRVEDNIECLQLTKRRSKSTRIVCFAMGRKGLISRVLSPVFGGYFTFASLSDDAKTAPGQPTIEDLRSLYAELGVYD